MLAEVDPRFVRVADPYVAVVPESVVMLAEVMVALDSDRLETVRLVVARFVIVPLANVAVVPESVVIPAEVEVSVVMLAEVAVRFVTVKLFVPKSAM